MKYAAAVALMLCTGVAAAHAQDTSVSMTFSGTVAASTINLKQPETTNSELSTAGDGTLGPFTFRTIRAIKSSPEPSSSCSGANQVYLSSVSGAGVFRFQDGSLLKVNLTQAGDCIDLAAMQANCTMAFQITGGTGRLQNATGTLALTETVLPVLADASSNPVFFASTGEFAGTISGVALPEQPQDKQQMSTATSCAGICMNSGMCGQATFGGACMINGKSGTCVPHTNCTCSCQF